MLAMIGLADGVRPPGWRRPFVESETAVNPPQLMKDEVEIVEYAEKDESTGEVRIYWIGPQVTDSLTAAALNLLGDYLSGSSIAPLRKEFVETRSPSCTCKSVITMSHSYGADRASPARSSEFHHDLSRSHASLARGKLCANGRTAIAWAETAGSDS